jgi:WD40 repeat protein
MSNPRDNIEAKLGLSGPPLQTVRNAPPQIPDHELIRRIGQGAYGEVWLARNALGTWRAVKIVYRDNFKDARPYEREFAGIRRFEPLSRSNEGFVDILQVGRDDTGGWFYYVMELADAAEPRASIQCSVASDQSREVAVAAATEISLNTEYCSLNTSYTPRTLSRDLHHRGRLPLEDCLELGLTLTLALGHLHRHGLIHRDVKPSNIIYVGGVPKLADTGLVTEAQGANTFVGTEGFVPPEGPTSPQADLYALGKVLYEAAMGKDRHEFPEPFTQIGTDRESVALMELNAVLLRACAPDPRKRYTTAEEMHADLALLHSGGSVKRRHQFDRQFQIAKQVGIVAIAATLLIGGAWLWQRQQTQKMTRLAEEKSTLATEKTKLADNLAKLDAENRNRIVRLDIANGLRLLDEGDPAGALLWFADALPLLTNNPAQESIHRIRIQQTLHQTPRVLHVFPHDSGVASGVFSPDGRFIATGTKDGNLRVWNVVDGTLVWKPKRIGTAMYHPTFLRFSRDGTRLFASSSWEQGPFNGLLPDHALFAVIDAGSGQEVLSPGETWPGMPSKVIAAHFSPDDRWLALAEKGGAIRVFDLAKREVLTDLKGHADDVGFLSFSADGSLMASASLDRTVRLWHLPSGEPAGPPLEHRWPVVRVLLTDDGRHLIAASFANPSEDSQSEVHAWDVANRRRLGGPISTCDWFSMLVAPSPQDCFFVDGVKGAEGVQAYSFDQPGKTVFRQEVGFLHSWHFSEDGLRLTLGGGNYIARVIDAQKGEPLTEPLRHGHWAVNSVKFSPDGSQLLTASTDGIARLWDLKGSPTEPVRHTLPAPLQSSHTEALDPGPEGIPLLLGDGTMRVIDDQLQESHCFTPPEPTAKGELLTCVRNARHSKLWWCRRAGGTNAPAAILLWRQEGKQIRHLTLPHPLAVLRDCLTLDEQHLVTYAGDRRIRFWSVGDGTLERSFDVPPADAGDVRNLSPNGKTAVWLEWTSGEPPGDSRVQRPYSVRFLDLESGEVVGDAIDFRAFGAAYSPDGKRLAIMDGLGPVAIIEARTGRKLASNITHSSNLNWAQWDPEGCRLLTAGSDDQVLVWIAETGTQMLGPLRTPNGIARVARWSPDGQFIITRSDDRRVRVWDAMTGDAVTPFWQHSSDVIFAIVTQQRRVVTAREPDQLQAWNLKETALPPDVLTDFATLLSGRRFGAGGALLPVPPSELADLNRSLRSRAPELFR